MKPLAALVLCLSPIPLQAQQPPPLNVLLPRLYAYAAQYRATLPSLTCDESIVTQALKKGKVKWQVRIESTLRELRKKDDPDPDDPFTEQHTFHTVDGKPPKKKFKLPYFVQGGFANLVGFHSPRQRDCFNYRLSSLGGDVVQLKFDLKPDSGNPDCAKIFPKMHGLFTADARTGHILHSERQISAKASRTHREAYFASLDYAPQQLGNLTFWLPTRLYAHNPRDDRRMYATYSNCHRYAVEMEILPGIAPAEPVPSASAAPAPNPR